jgi:uncharacterized SAM-binding protein YcdF (DUF218 family)
MSLRRRLMLCVAGGALVVPLAWGAGLAWFIPFAARPAEAPPVADGIVALSGGADRVETALRLLREHRAQWLLLSGIGGGVELTALAHRAGVDPAPLVEQVTIGRQATTTRGNALETAAWVTAHDVRSLIVVTAFYHMPRALTELRRALPGVTLYPAPVLVPDPAGGGRAVTLRLIAEEYSKYLLAVTGTSALLPEREPAALHTGRGG